MTEERVLDEVEHLRVRLEELEAALAIERVSSTVLRQSEERLRVLSSIVTEGVMVHADRVVVDANQAFADILGLDSPAQLIGRDGLQVIKMTSESQQRMLDNMGSDYTEAYLIEVIRPDGTHVPVETHGREIEYRGQPARLVYMRDVSAHQRTVHALHESEQFYREIFNATSDALFIHDEAGCIVDVNERMCTMFCCERDVAIGSRAADFSYGESPYSEREVGIALEQAKQRGSRTFRWRSRRWDGELFWSEVALRACVIGGRSRVIASVRDISERVQAQAEKDELQDQLQHSMKMEAVGRLAGGVAHDFNNLLTVITGNVGLAQEEVGPDHPLQSYLQEVSQASASAAALTRQLLAFSRRQLVEPRVLDLNELVANVQKLLLRLIGEDITVRTRLDPALGLVRLDPAQFEQVLVNLAVNARDAMPDGGELEIETGSHQVEEGDSLLAIGLHPGPYARLTVADTGCGMSEEVKQHLFEPFFTTKTVGQGTGLGLATIFGSVQQAGGAIQVESELGMGTTFHLYLPCSDGDLSSHAESQGKISGPRGGENILLVEDDRGVRELARAFLVKLGYHVLLASSGQEALALVQGREGGVDLLLTDLVMPGMSGQETAERLLARQPDLKVLFMSGYTDDVVMRQGIFEHQLNFISKPFSYASLAARLRAVLDSGRSSESAHGEHAREDPGEG